VCVCVRACACVCACVSTDVKYLPSLVPLSVVCVRVCVCARACILSVYLSACESLSLSLSPPRPPRLITPTLIYFLCLSGSMHVCMCVCVHVCTCVCRTIVSNAYQIFIITVRSREDQTRNGHWNAKRNPNRNQEPIVLGLFSKFRMKKDLEKKFLDSDLHFVLHLNDYFKSQFSRERAVRHMHDPCIFKMHGFICFSPFKHMYTRTERIRLSLCKHMYSYTERVSFVPYEHICTCTERMSLFPCKHMYTHTQGISIFPCKHMYACTEPSRARDEVHACICLFPYKHIYTRTECISVSSCKDMYTCTEPSGARDKMEPAILDHLGPFVPMPFRMGIIFTARCAHL